MLCESSCNAVTRFESGVLILVLMEDALREDNQTPEQSPEKGLNPCSNGRCSARFNNQYSLNDFKAVLILVLMEDALREIVQPLNNESLWVLILVLMEDALRGYLQKLLQARAQHVLILVLMEDALRVDESNIVASF